MADLYRVGHKVPRTVYEGDVPLFVAATPELASRIVRVLNRGAAHASIAERAKHSRLRDAARALYMAADGGTQTAHSAYWDVLGREVVDDTIASEATPQYVTSEKLQEIMGLEEYDLTCPLADEIHTHDGFWKRVPNLWEFHPNEEVSYQYREIGEGEGWRDCSKESYEAFQSDPHIDTRKVTP